MRHRILRLRKMRKPAMEIIMKIFASRQLFMMVAVAMFALLPGRSMAPAFGTQQDAKGPKFRWAFGAIRASSSSVEPLSGTVGLKSGDKVRAMIELRGKCFVYLIHHSSQGEITMLFPYDLKQFDTDYREGRTYFVPKGEAWFQLDNRTGRETFYLVASDQRLLDIEYLYNRYVSAEPERRPELAAGMLSEIDGLRVSYLASEHPEIRDGNSGINRGFERATGADPTDVSALASDVWFDNVFSNVIVIEHR